jgi:hypothetical protein
MMEGIEYKISPRGFTYAEISQHGKLLCSVNCSSAMDRTCHPAMSLKDADGNAEPGTSFLWLHVERPGNDGEKVSCHLDRKQVAELTGIMLRWLATGFVEKEIN